MFRQFSIIGPNKGVAAPWVPGLSLLGKCCLENFKKQGAPPPFAVSIDHSGRKCTTIAVTVCYKHPS